MRFVHVNHRYFPYVGGSERYMQEVSEMLANHGHDVTVVTSDAHDLEYFWDRRMAAVDAPGQSHVNGVMVRRVPVRHFPGSPLVFQASRRLMGEVSRVRLPAGPFTMVSTRLPSVPGLASTVAQCSPFDLLHVANLGIEGLGITAARESIKTTTPVVVTPFIHLGVAEDSVARRYVSMPHQRKLLQAAQSVVVMTQFEASFVKSLGVAEENVWITGVGVNPSEVTCGCAHRFRERHGITGRVIGTVGAVAFEKGSRELVNGLYELRRRGHNVELVLAGPRMQQFDRWFGSLSPERTAGVHLLGFIDAEEKRDMLAALDVLAMPSRTESFGIAYLEGWANRKPALAANAGAVPELVRHRQNGILVEFGDQVAVAEAILELLSDTDAARDMGERGYALTMEQFTWPAVLERVKAAYSGALGYRLSEVVGDV